ncbi:hypothetical protein ASPVEDRAFT_38218 [Aspergillus versicolor CBS 583.65]|uniref:Uncharacterized protein n=1 Tax=Aspergillus versicolor CBS 583.65 TaxID=1036611 RepID=A0A1L9PB63_ASPVE|nr:uncharacterized protein ASPVEDRAFT_38218 [Aspergillus versicolor CBS 583.65]OJI98712.1 hypothetical protein ASPVEDRAFT_38218 [Aspergillus versicolor CBS 583.65]
MPRHRPVSPLALETCPLRDSDLDDYELACSDDDLDESQRSARRRRVEKLGEAYLKGTSLFILSASLRGPLDGGWVNPWKKDRRKTAENKRDNGPTEQPVIPETNSHKRRHHQSPTVIPCSASSATRQTWSRPERSPTHAKLKPTDREPGLASAARDSQSPRFTRYKPTDSKWLKKGKVSTRFQNIEPPTSPTTSISSRQLKKGGAAGSQSNGRPGSADYESARTSKGHQRKHSKQLESENSVSSSHRGRHTLGSTLQKDSSQSVNGSVHVVSSSSQLPKFEYRLKQHGKPTEKIERQHSPKPREEDGSEAGTVGTSDVPADKPEKPPDKSPLTCGAEPIQVDPNVQQNTMNSTTLTNASNIAENPMSTNLDKGLVNNPTNETTSANNLPSAQHAAVNPAPSDNLTSLYSIAVSKATSNRTEEHNADQQFSTQAALMMAQKSFQNDILSPDCSPVTSAKKRRASQDPNHHSPNAVNITPFHAINTRERGIPSGLNELGTDRREMLSTQYMVDAVTPFTFSTEKKAEFRTLSSGKDISKDKKRKTTSFALSSPSEIPSEDWTPEEEHTEGIVQPNSAEARNSPSGSEQNALPMTLTGTTPPTAQEGQAVESFDLSQAIAEAGSWLQQSFEINKDITHCKSAQLPRPYPSETAQ